ncbi:MAG: radical SAM protein [Candidatus Brocadiales bacterium]|nr:radical SAM protein [Candidatus Bathyanammoxibius sp.]
MSGYLIKSIWRTIQGEGIWTGCAATFVRFTGCNMWSGEEKDRERDAKRNKAGCPRWCDTDFRKAGSTKHDTPSLIEHIKGMTDPGEIIVFTGGEPLLQIDDALLRLCHQNGFRTHFETNGTLPFMEKGDHAVRSSDKVWITVSPKTSDASLKIEYAHEIKFVVPDYLPENYPDLVARIFPHHDGKLIWLNPEDGPRFKESCRLVLDLVGRSKGFLRAGVQAHKILGAE